MNVTNFEFRTFAGLPQNGDDGQFLGFDADGCCYVMWWDARGMWCAVGRDPVHTSSPVAFAADRVAERIVRHAPMPSKWHEVLAA